MSSKPEPYLRQILQPTANTTYLISDFIGDTLNSADEYSVVCESPYATLTVKTSTTFRIEVSINSPAFPNTCWLEFYRPVSPATGGVAGS